MDLVPIDHSNSDIFNQPAMDDERHYHHHQHHHHHYYHHDQDQQHSSKPNELSTNQHHHDHQQCHHQLKPAYQVYCRADYNYALTIRDGKVVLAPSDPSNPHQHWYKEEKFKTQVKDAIGLPSFALVNKATGAAIKHSVAGGQPVQLTKYDPKGVDESILWSEGCIKDDDGEYKAIRMVNNIGLNMDAFGAIKERGGVHDGTTIGLWEWNAGDNQRWKIIPY